MNVERFIELEKAILGTLISNNDKLVEIYSKVKVEDFYRTSHQIIYKAICDLYKKNIKFDLSILMTTLNKEIQTGAVTITELTEIFASQCDTSVFKTYVDMFMEEVKQRKIDKLLRSIDANKELTSDEKITLIQNGMLNLLENTNTDKFISLSDVVYNTTKKIESAYVNGTGHSGISTGIRGVDNLTNGLQREEFILIGARPSMGKTAFCLKILEGIKGKVLFVQLDMGLNEIGQRMLASKTNIENGKLGRGKLNQNEWENLSNALNNLSRKDNIHFLNEASCKIENLKMIARQYKLKFDLDVLIIDHIGLLKTDKKGSTYEQMSFISHSLKEIAKELNIAVLGLCQLSRAVEQRQDKRPMLSDLRDSGKLEEDADVIGFLYRDGYYSTRENPNITLKVDDLELYFLKMRNGRVGGVNFRYFLDTQRICELER